jgi:phosphatidylglycerol lysyltransferase
MKSRRWLRPLLALILLGVAVVVLERRLQGLDFGEVWRALAKLPRVHLVLAALLTAANYAWLSLYDAAALAYLGKSLSGGRILLTSFVATAFGHNIGPSFASGGSVRYRYYSEFGLSGREVASLVSFIAVTFVVGFAWVGGAVLLTTPSDLKFGAPLSPLLLRAIGGVFLALGALYLALCCLRRSIRVRGKTLTLPSPRLVGLQIAVAGGDWLVMAAILTLFMPKGSLHYSEVLHTLVVSQIAAMLSQVPGGVGVFESLVLSALGPHVPAAGLVGALVAYRVLYFFVPLVLSILIMATGELRRRLAARSSASSSVAGSG